jgi:hypothetical protein
MRFKKLKTTVGIFMILFIIIVGTTIAIGLLSGSDNSIQSNPALMPPQDNKKIILQTTPVYNATIDNTTNNTNITTDHGNKNLTQPVVNTTVNQGVQQAPQSVIQSQPIVQPAPQPQPIVQPVRQVRRTRAS